jgi:hypothetical protein
MANPKPFESSRAKIGRAKHHISDLDACIERFLKEYDHEIVIEDDVEPGYKVHKARLTQALPPELALIAGDAVTNLRAALDHIGYSVALAMGVTKPTDYHFPFHVTAAEFNLRACKKLPNEIQALFASFKPYRDGNVLLWALNAICNRDKHALLNPVCVSNHATFVKKYGPAIVERPTKPGWDYLKNEIELFRTKGEPKYDLHLAIDVGFDGPSPLVREPMVPTLNAFAGIAESILVAVEAETRRLFPAAFQ